MRVLVVYKQSVFSEHRRVAFRRALARKNFWERGWGAQHEAHQKALKHIRRVLAAEGIPAQHLFRGALNRNRKLDELFDLVVSVGGDGTFLETARYLRRTPILGVNSDPARSVGRLCAATAENFHIFLKIFREGRLKPRPLARLAVSMNGKKYPFPVVNDILICAAIPAETSRYLLRVGKREEEQLSSGIWVAAPAGTGAAYRSAGGKVLPLFSRKSAYWVREPYPAKPAVPRLKHGVLSDARKISVVSLMREGRIFLDGPRHRLPFCFGDRLEVSLSAPALKILGMRP